jgi:Domain of unknown function (DUF1737)
MVSAYEIVSEHDLGDLKNKVNDMLGKGWQPYGDLQVSTPVQYNGVDILYTQVMVKMNG